MQAIRMYIDCSREKERCQKELKDAEALLLVATRCLNEYLVLNEIDSVTQDGMTLKPILKVHARVNKSDEEDFIKELKEVGYESLVSETVHYKKIEALYLELQELDLLAKDNILKYISVYEEPSIKKSTAKG